MKKRIIISSILLTLLVGFQNCSPSLTTQNGAGKVNATGESVTPAPSIKSLEIVADSINDPLAQTQKSNPGNLLVDLNNGNISVVDDSTQRYCLSQSDLDKVKLILSTAQICENRQPVRTDVACTMLYRFPYAKLYTVDSEIALGEFRSGCDQGPDLCGDHKQMLVDFIRNLQGNLADQVCQFSL